jgi:hypothetical protein
LIRCERLNPYDELSSIIIIFGFVTPTIECLLSGDPSDFSVAITRWNTGNPVVPRAGSVSDRRLAEGEIMASQEKPVRGRKRALGIFNRTAEPISARKLFLYIPLWAFFCIKFSDL